MIGYFDTVGLEELLPVGSTINVNVPDSGLVLVDAGGGSIYSILKRYSEIQIESKIESDNFKLGITFFSRNSLRIENIGLASTSVRYKIIRIV